MKSKKTVLSLLLVIIIITLFCIVPVSALYNVSSIPSSHACGLKPDEENDLYQIREFDRNNIIDSVTRDTIPSSVDLSLSDAFPPIGNQGNIGSCGSWATAYYQFGYQVAAMNNWDAKHDLSKCFSPKFVFNIAKYDNGHSTFFDNYQVLKNCGAVRYSEFVPSTVYSDSEVNQWCTNTEYLTNALRNRVYAIYQNQIVDPSIIVSPYDSPYCDYLHTMKSLLYTDHVLVIDTVFGEDIYVNLNNTNFWGNSEWQFGIASNGDIVCKECVTQSNNPSHHALAVVGYDDNIWYDYNQNGLQEDSELGAFKVANSWGDSYCNGGFVWVMYDALNRVSVNLPTNSNRVEAFTDYKYYSIEVCPYDLDLVAKVTVKHNSRMDLTIENGISSLTQTNPSTTAGTIFTNHGGGYPIEGINLNPIATIPIDYGTFINGDRNRKCYYLNLIDSNNNNMSATIYNVQLIDKSGHVVLDDSTLSILNSHEIDPLSLYGIPDIETRRYRIGMLGDVDNDGSVDNMDAALIQRINLYMNEPTNEELISADVNGDGTVDVFDVTTISRYTVGLGDASIINGYFAGGYLVNLDGDVPTY